MFTVCIKAKGKTIRKQYENSVSADQVLRDAQIQFPRFCGGNGKCGKCQIILDGKTVLACQTYINSNAVIDYHAEQTALLGVSEMNVPITAQDPIVKEGFGAAIDIGTTTVAGYIYHFPSCELVKSVCVANPQLSYGADVISRINYALTASVNDLKKAILQTIEEITDSFPIEKYVICGNTAMMYFLTGKRPESLAVAPYTAEHLFGHWKGNMYLIKCLSAFIGGDITAAVLSSGIKNDSLALLVDIGTNGEMVLKSGDRYICCSTAAGPCFEGAGIDCGMQAVPGAINAVFLENNEIKFTTIGNVPPIGICGTGLIDAVASLLEMGIINDSGYMEDTYYFAGSSVYISPNDVRQFQVAKSAICSGIETLLDYEKINCSCIEKCYISGGFGSYLNIASAVSTGLIPAELCKKTTVLGNGAGAGASLLLLNQACLEESVLIAENAKTLDLTTNRFFMEKYIDNMYFKNDGSI